MKYLLASVVALAGAAPSLGSPASANLVAQDREPTPDVVKLFREEFVPIAGGKFTMGSAAGGKSEQPAHAVTIGRAFQIARYEVPQNLWQRVMGENPSRWKGPHGPYRRSYHRPAAAPLSRPPGRGCGTRSEAPRGG